jgi:hypothetical protein
VANASPNASPPPSPNASPPPPPEHGCDLEAAMCHYVNVGSQSGLSYLCPPPSAPPAHSHDPYTQAHTHDPHSHHPHDPHSHDPHSHDPHSHNPHVHHPPPPPAGCCLGTTPYGYALYAAAKSDLHPSH